MKNTKLTTGQIMELKEISIIKKNKERLFALEDQQFLLLSITQGKRSIKVEVFGAIEVGEYGMSKDSLEEWGDADWTGMYLFSRSDLPFFYDMIEVSEEEGLSSNAQICFYNPFTNEIKMVENPQYKQPKISDLIQRQARPENNSEKHEQVLIMAVSFICCGHEYSMN